MIYRFTNARGYCHYGVVTRLYDNGAYVLSDTWTPSEQVQIPAHYAYVSFAPNPYVSGQTRYDLLPLDTLVPWQTPEIRQIIELMQAGKFDEWWVINEALIIRKFIGGYGGQP